MKKKITGIFALLLAAVIGINLSGCAKRVQAADLSQGITPVKVEGKAADAKYSAAQMNFALKLLEKTFEEKGKENLLVSPVSVTLALAMTSNGADGETKKQFETLLGSGMDTDELNAYLYAFLQSFSNENAGKLKTANSIWFNTEHHSFEANRTFLQKNADYYGAAAYKSVFNEKTLRDINNWVKMNTDGMIEKIIDDLDPDAVMYLINTVLFDAEWENIYKKDEVRDGTFTALDGTKRTASMMYSAEHLYLDDGKAIGFIKPYRNGYSFVALLPNEDISLSDYAASMTGKSFADTIKNAEDVPVEAAMPKFSYDYDIEMSGALKALGMSLPFDPEKADFSALGYYESGNIFISRVLHKAYITVDEKGTKAGAATAADIKATSDTGGLYSVTLDRPFVYAVIDDACGLPVFIGAVTDIGK